MVIGHLHGCFTLPRNRAGEHFVEHDAYGINVGSCVADTTCRNFGCHVGNRSEHRAGRGHRDFGCRACKTKIGDADGPLTGNKNIFWFDIPVDDANTVGGAQRLEDVLRVLQRL